MKKIPYRIIKIIENIPNIEKIIWAYTEVKRCSDFQILDKDKKVVLDSLHHLGLVYDGSFIRTKSWPSQDKLSKGQDKFSKKYHKKGEYNGDLEGGLFYDIPFCCAKAYRDEEKIEECTFYANFPFDGEKNLNVVLINAEKNGEDFNSFLERLNEHARKNGFYENYSISLNRFDKTIRAIMEGILPESVFLLTGLTYIPCKINCEKFINKSELMLKSLKLTLSEERVSIILEKYRQFSLEGRDL